MSSKEQLAVKYVVDGYGEFKGGRVRIELIILLYVMEFTLGYRFNIVK